MTGVSIGYFTPEAIVDDVAAFTRSVSRVIGKCLPAFPLELRTVEGLSHAYAKVDGHIPLHIDSVGKHTSDTKIFQFVFATENRPMLLTGAAGDPGGGNVVDQQRSKIMLNIHDKEEVATTGFGATELVAGMFVHFDVSKIWHGVTAAPVPMRELGLRQDPKAIIIQIIGYEAHEYAEAHNTMHKMLYEDRAYWMSGKPDVSRRYRR